MANARIEEVEDDDELIDDPDEMDLDAFDFAKPQGTLGQEGSSSSQVTPDMMQALMGGRPRQNVSTGNTVVPQMPRMSAQEAERMQREQQEQSKSFQCVYPVYFDSTRSREEGRRVSKQDAVPNPLAREIVEALANIGQSLGVPLQLALEPGKTHPKDWANPGRVKVLLKTDGRPISAKIQNKHHLYKLISEYLKSHPTTEDTPKRLQIQGLPMTKERIPPAVPRGFKVGTILPLHSPALSGGGVSDNMFRDMMAEMGGQLPGGMGLDAPSQQPQKKVKDKKKK